MVGERVDAEQAHTRTVRQHVGPRVTSDAVDGCLDEPEVDRFEVGHDQQPVALDVDAVLHAGIARLR